MTKKKKNRLVLIDGHSLLFRAYYAFPYLTSPEGEMVNAVYGFTSMLLSVIGELEPTHIAVCFDSEGPTFRKSDFDQYKANRPKPPEELIGQIDRTQGVVKALNMPMFAIKGWEADDLIGTLALQASGLKIKDQKSPNQSKRGTGQVKIKNKEFPLETIIVTGDMDMTQLINDPSTHSASSGQAGSGPSAVFVFVPGRKSKPAVMMGEKEVKARMGVDKDHVVDLKGLAGDSSDNIPGIKGIGPKTAIGLLDKFGSIEGIYREVDAIAEAEKRKSGKAEKQLGDDWYKTLAGEMGFGVSVVKKLVEGREMALVSRELARIRTDAPIEFDLEKCKVHGYDKGEAMELFDELGFKSLKTRLPEDEFERNVQDALF